MDKITALYQKKLQKYLHLKKIRDRLWGEDGISKVSVMIGSGFSLNANKLDDSLESMSTWQGLKEKVHAGLNRKEISSKNVLDISESYVKEYGRDSLDTLIKQAVPDQNYEPGEIHRSLLKLPWADVYTTNYDTLLERTLPYIVERNYDVIYDVRDIPNSVAPRIVKLHGSFPSNRPFIFTRGDFNSYNENFAPLVNMVQQSIMETTFVLLGFSGDDPNFESWTKWVHKNLGEHMPKVYMLAHNEYKREDILNERGITLIDFKEVYEGQNQGNVYGQMFTDLFQYLSYKEKKDEKDWPYKSYLSQSGDELATFIHNRKSYPGWLIMPDIIKRGNIETLQLACNELEKLATDEEELMTERISAINEIIWAYDTFQIPINFHLQQRMKKIVDENIKSEYARSIGIIAVRLLKEARLDYNESEFNKYLEILGSCYLTKEVTNRITYEKILMKTAKYEYNEAKRLIEKWSLTHKDIEWNVKKAVIFSRIGEKEKAIKILEDNLTTVRSVIAVKNNNYRLLSLEGIIISSLIRLRRNTLQNSKERLSILESRLSNPLKELDFMYSRIKPFESKAGSFRKKGFDPNRFTQTSRFESIINLELIDSYSLLMLHEEFGLGAVGRRKIIKNAINISLKNIEILYPFYTWIMYLQVGDIKEIDSYFSREVIYRAEKNSLSLFVGIVIDGIDSKHNTFLMLEVLSRIYFALQKSEKLHIDNIVIELYKNKKFQNENRKNSSKKVFEHLFRRILFDKNHDEKGKFISEIYKLPIVGDPDGSLAEIYSDELTFYDPSFEFDFRDDIKIDIDITEVLRLQRILKGEKSNLRDASLKRLAYLLETNNLPDGFEEKLRTDIANIVSREKSHFCDGMLDSYLVLLTNDFDLQEQYSRELIQKPIPRSYNKGVTFFGEGLKRLLNNLSNVFPGFKNKSNRFLTLTEETYNIWLNNFYEWWDSQEKWLLRDETDSLFGENDDLLSMVLFLKGSFLSNFNITCLTVSDKKKLKEIYLNLYRGKYHLALLMIPVFIRIGVISEDNIDRLYDGLMSENIEIFKSSAVGIYDLSVLESLNEIEVDLSEIKTTMINIFKYRKETTLFETTKLISNIIADIPSFFNNDDYLSIISSLKLIFNEFEQYDNELLVKQEKELLPELANLAGQIYFIGKADYKDKLKYFKVFIEEHRLPEVRRYSDLFK